MTHQRTGFRIASVALSNDRLRIYDLWANTDILFVFLMTRLSTLLELAASIRLSPLIPMRPAVSFAQSPLDTMEEQPARHVKTKKGTSCFTLSKDHPV